MPIQWFPGHMAKARREVTEALARIDVVLELVDARLPLASRNPMMDEIVQHKPRLVLLNKSDMADARATTAWIEFFAQRNISAIAIDAVHGAGMRELIDQTQRLGEPKLAALAARGIRPRPIRALILGIPNVGKSSLINRLAKRSVAATGDRPGITKAQQWIKVGTGLELLDTPGILWPKFDDQMTGLLLAASGAIKAEVIDQVDVALNLLGWLARSYPESLADRYKLTDVTADPSVILEAIGERRGAKQKGGRIDFDSVALLILREFQTGHLGRITLEWPSDTTKREPEHVQ